MEVSLRRLVAAAVLMCAACACAAAQVPQFEVFDRSGLPARPQTDTERDLARRIAGHRRGDAAGAARIQRGLAGYYRSRGDHQRARAAEERALAAERVYGGLPPVTATRKAPAEALNDAGAVTIPVYQADAPAEEKKSEVPEPAAPAVEPPPAVPAAEAAEPGGEAPLSGRFHVLQGRTLHRWEFRPDGTFEHAWTFRGGAGAAGMETGTYSVSGPFVTLFIERRAGAPARSGRRLRFERRAAGGLMLDGTLLEPGLP